MSFRQAFANSFIPASRARSAEAVKPTWEDTVPAPFDPLRESDLRQAGAAPYDTFAMTMPMGLSAK
ncbi:MAG: hypothetical protein JWQ33_2052 [Ramlibacter sp.]|nr:hypothetical protein [Ramlibacter sp.]